jgi:hypothetical protein
MVLKIWHPGTNSHGRGKEFMNKLLAELFQLLNISYTKMSQAHPQCNAQVEVFNKTVKKFLQF